MSDVIAGIRVPDSAIARAATQLVRDTEDDLLYNHSRRVFLWGALTGERRGLKYDPELLYLGAMFHDMGLTETYWSADLRFEVDGANAAREFMKSYGVPERDIEDVWTAIALHTTPGIPEHMRPIIALGDHRRGDGRARHRLSRLHVRAAGPCLRPSSTRDELQGEHHRSLRQRHYQEAADDVRKCKGRCPGVEGCELCPPKLLLDHPWLSLAKLTLSRSRRS
ncbi:hypothetical protein ACVWXQ_000608 [Bradyrhizobium sp. S3.14.4]